MAATRRKCKNYVSNTHFVLVKNFCFIYDTNCKTS